VIDAATASGVLHLQPTAASVWNEGLQQKQASTSALFECRELLDCVAEGCG
jgi:hypothetical protein